MGRGRTPAAEYRAARLSLGLTQRGLAERVGVTANTVARRERGELPVGAEATLALSAVSRCVHCARACDEAYTCPHCEAHGRDKKVWTHVS